MKTKWVKLKDLIGLEKMPETVQGLTFKAKSQNWRRRKIDGVRGIVYEYYVGDMPKYIQQHFNFYNKSWYEIKELLGVAGLPTTVQGLTKKAKLENWRRRRINGVKGIVYEYFLNDMPTDVKKLLNIDSYNNLDDEININENIQNVIKIPFYDIQAFYSMGRVIFDEQYLNSYKLLESDYILTNQFNKDKLIFISASGDSMQPLIYASDLLLVDLNQITPINGQVFLIQHLDQIWIKKIQGIKGGYRLISENKNYDVIEFLNDELKDLKIIGRIVQVTHNLN